MTRYAFHCEACGGFELDRPIGTAPTNTPCPVCGGWARRAITAAALLGRDQPRSRLIERAERSAEDPDVVTRPPSTGPRVAPDPRHRGLPRP